MRLNKKITIFIIFILMLIGAIATVNAYTGIGFSHQIPESTYSGLSTNDILSRYNETDFTTENHGICTQVYDGDTIYVEGVGKVRLVGVNTPERGVTGASTSTNFVKKLCLNNDVGLDIDDSKPHDKYGRTLAVVIVDGRNLNEILLNEGLAEIMYIPPSEFNPYSWVSQTSIISTTTTDASSGNSNSGDTGSYVGSRNSNIFHNPDCRWAKKITETNKIVFSSRDDAINQGFRPCNVCNP